MHWLRQCNHVETLFLKALAKPVAHAEFRLAVTQVCSNQRTRKMLTRILPLVAVALALQSASAVACSVPVFRYALEQWQADSLQLVVFHRGELSAEHQALVSRIEPQGLDAKYVANTWVKTVDLDGAQNKELLELWEQQDEEAAKGLPWICLLYTSPSPRDCDRSRMPSSA